MKKALAGLLGLAMLALANVATAAEVVVDPSKFTSLQPFKKFGAGEGYGIAHEYVSRNKAQFVALLRDPAQRKLLRISCDRLVQQLVEANPDLHLPFEGCPGALAEIERNPKYVVEACRDEMVLKESWVVVTDAAGSSMGVWQRRCLKDEHLLVYKDKEKNVDRPLASTMCGNALFRVKWVVTPTLATPVAQAAPAATVEAKPAVAAAAPAPAPAPAAAKCPNGYEVALNGWDPNDFSPGLHRAYEVLLKAAEVRDSNDARDLEAYKPSAVSRTLGWPFRHEVKKRAAVSSIVQVRLLDPKTMAVESLAAVQLRSGEASVVFSDSDHNKVIETVWPDDEYASPAKSGGERRLRLFPEEWGKWCKMYVHGVLRR